MKNLTEAEKQQLLTDVRVEIARIVPNEISERIGTVLSERGIKGASAYIESPLELGSLFLSILDEFTNDEKFNDLNLVESTMNSLSDAMMSLQHKYYESFPVLNSSELKNRIMAFSTMWDGETRYCFTVDIDKDPAKRLTLIIEAGDFNLAELVMDIQDDKGIDRFEAIN